MVPIHLKFATPVGTISAEDCSDRWQLPIRICLHIPENCDFVFFFFFFFLLLLLLLLSALSNYLSDIIKRFRHKLRNRYYLSFRVEQLQWKVKSCLPQIIAWVDRLPLTLDSLPNEPQTNRKISMLLNLGVTRSTDQGEAKVKLVTKRQNELKSDFARFATHLQTVCYFSINILFAVYVPHLHVNTLNYTLIFYPVMDITCRYSQSLYFLVHK